MDLFWDTITAYSLFGSTYLLTYLPTYLLTYLLTYFLSHLLTYLLRSQTSTCDHQELFHSRKKLLHLEPIASPVQQATRCRRSSPAGRPAPHQSTGPLRRSWGPRSARCPWGPKIKKRRELVVKKRWKWCQVRNLLVNMRKVMSHGLFDVMFCTWSFYNFMSYIWCGSDCGKDQTCISQSGRQGLFPSSTPHTHTQFQIYLA